MSDLQQFRSAKDQFFATDPHSPLTDAQKRRFRGLNYFPENALFQQTVTIEEYATQQTVALLTTKGDPQPYLRLGRIPLVVDGQVAHLTVYRNDRNLFLPFIDSLAGRETYGAGRYLELSPLGQGRFLADFNHAYNPYCAYNDGWSCPITPLENRLAVAIRAGEKIFADVLRS